MYTHLAHALPKNRDQTFSIIPISCHLLAPSMLPSHSRRRMHIIDPVHLFNLSAVLKVCKIRTRQSPSIIQIILPQWCRIVFRQTAITRFTLLCRVAAWSFHVESSSFCCALWRHVAGAIVLITYAAAVFSKMLFRGALESLTVARICGFGQCRVNGLSFTVLALIPQETSMAQTHNWALSCGLRTRNSHSGGGN